MSKDIKVERDGFVAVITLDRPHKLNAVTADMADALMATAEELNADDAIRCVILTGAGDRAFCAGSDIGGLGDSTTPWNFRNRPHYSDAVRLLRNPAIAAINDKAAETAKINLRATIGMSYENAIAYERDLGTICFATEDAEEGRRAFAEKRPAVFKRR